MRRDLDDFDSETIDVGDIDLPKDADEQNEGGYGINPQEIVQEYSPRDPVEIEETENTPEWLVYQVGKMRNKADEVRDFLDIYSRFMDEDWEEMPSEVHGFLEHLGYQEGDRDPLEWLVGEASEAAVELCERRDLVLDNYHGIKSAGPIRGGGKRNDLDSESREKIQSEIAYATGALNSVEHAGATTEGGWTEPYPSVNIEPERSLGHRYKQTLEEEAKDVDWFIEREAHWD